MKKPKTDASSVQKITKIKHDEKYKPDKKRRSNEENEVKNVRDDHSKKEVEKSKLKEVKSSAVNSKKVKEEVKSTEKIDERFDSQIKPSAVLSKDVPKSVVQSPKGISKEVPT